MATYSVHWNTAIPESCQRGALTIGNFDGVHLGHQALLQELRRHADSVHGPAVAMTFDPPPSQLLRPGSSPASLMTVDDRAELMQKHGADHVLILATTLELLQRSAPEFFDTVIHHGVAPKVMVPGFNFAFGHKREGTVATLTLMCQEASIACFPLPPFDFGGKPVSSSRIRAALLAGDVADAARQLGRPYRVRGTVTTGQRRGQALGFPTANLDAVPTLVPGNGVYAVSAQHAGRQWAGAANIGPNPTFGEQQRKLEVHLIDFSGDLYGEVLAVDFLERIREIQRFESPAQLVKQLHADIAAARLATRPVS